MIKAWIRQISRDSSLLILAAITAQPSLAQVIPDTTLPRNSAVTRQGNTIVIQGGTTAGGNLFHSFDQFSLPTGNNAYFNNAATILNIITRITGNSISKIDGTLQANGSANLFLLNPNGIIFGPNAALNIGGSFIATSANQIAFADGTVYSATEPDATPLLTMSVPIGLQFGSNPQPLSVQGPGNQIQFDPNNTQTETADLYSFTERPVGLQVNAGQSLGLIGGDILLDGGNLTAPAGYIHLGSVASEGTVAIASQNNNWSFNYPQFQQFGLIRLANGASVDASGNGGGSIQIQGQQLSLAQGSAVFSLTFGSQAGQDIEIRTRDRVDLSGANPQGLYSFIVTGAYPNSTGDSGDILIETGTLQLREGGLIFSSPFSSGNGGSVSVRATEAVELTGLDPDGFGSYLGTATTESATGNAGNLLIDTGRFVIADGGLVNAATNGAGQGGLLRVQARDRIELRGSDRQGNGSRLQTEAGVSATGNAGELMIETQRLSVRDGGIISAGTSGAGAAGTLNITATEAIEVSGSTLNDQPSRLTTAVETGATGAGSHLTISTGRLRVENGGLISTTSTSSTPAGNLTIHATESVELIGQKRLIETITRLSTFSIQPTDLRNGLFTVSFGLGNSGSLNVNTRTFRVSEGAIALASNFGGGQGGSMVINTTDLVEVSGALVSNGNVPRSIGDTGNVTINTRNLVMRDGGIISTGTAGLGRGGNLTVNATESVELIGGNPFLVLGTPTDTNLSTSTLGPGAAGDLTISTPQLSVLNGAVLSTSTFGPGRGGTMRIFATDQMVVDGFAKTPLRPIPSLIYSSTESSGNAGDIIIETPTLTLSNGALLAADTGGSRGSGGNIATGSAGNITIISDAFRMENQASLSARSTSGDRGNISIQANHIQLRRNSQVTTDASGTATGGNIRLATDVLIGLENSDISANAQQGAGGQVEIASQGIFGIGFRDRPSPSTSDITASSELGASFSGTVTISTPDVDPSSGLVELPTVVTDLSDQISTGCDRLANSSFLITGRGGLPPSPVDPLSQGTVFLEWAQQQRSQQQRAENLPHRATAIASHTQPADAPIQEAQGWIVNAKGEIILTPDPVAVTPGDPWSVVARCNPVR